MMAAPLAGRAAELGQLDQWVRELASGLGRVVLVEGEPGIGKSALLRAAADLAAAARCAVFRGAGEELGQAFPLRPLLDAFAVRQPPPGGDAGAAAQALLALVDQLCTGSAAMLVVDDLQWADAMTVSVCRRLADTAAQRQLLLIAAMRPLPQREDLRALRRTVAEDGLIRLGPLDEAAVTDVVAGLATADGVGRLGPALTRLAAGAAGNPLYLTELIGALDRSGSLVLRGGALEATAKPASATLSDAISDRLDFLDPAARQVLQAAALLGGEFTVADLSIVLDRPPAELAPTLATASAASVLVDAGPRLAFRHPLIRAALYDGLPAAVRTALHHDAARALRDAGAAVVDVARQLLPTLQAHEEARRPVLANWVLDWLVDAAPELVSQSPPVAVELLEAAIAQLAPTAGRRAVLVSRLCEALFGLSRFDRAAELAESTLPDVADPAVFTALHATLARCAWATRPQAGVARLQSALARPDLSRRERGRLHAYTAWLLGASQQAEAAAQAAHDALALAGDEADPVTLCNAFSALAVSRACLGDERAAVELHDRALAAVKGHPEYVALQLRTMVNSAMQHMAVDDVAVAETMYRQVQRLAERTGTEYVRIGAHVWLAILFFEIGRWDDALTEASLAEMHGSAYQDCQRDAALGLIALHRGDADAARRHLQAAENAAVPLGEQLIGHLWLGRSLTRERDGDVHAALDVLAHDDAELRQFDVQEVEVMVADAVRLAVAAGDKATAARLTAYADTLPAGDQIPHRAAIRLHCRGLLSGDPALLLRAADGHAQVQRTLPRAQALEAAAALVAEAGDTAAARAPFIAALDLYTELGASWDVTRTLARFRARGLHPPRRRGKRPATGWDALTPTEARVAELVAAGRSNPEIAEDLFVSRHTVATHVARVLAKLQVRSRIDLIRRAADLPG